MKQGTLRRVLVTGASGLLGREVCRRLTEKVKGVKIVGVARSGAAVDCSDHVWALDLTQPDAWRQLLPGPYDAVIHLAAVIPGADDGFRSFADNAAMAYHLHNFCREACPHYLVYASSISVYPLEGPLPFQEDIPPEPATPYAVAKLTGEYLALLCGSWCSNVACLRFSSLYGLGTREYHERTVLNVFMDRARVGDHLTVYGRGERTQDFLYVTDAADGVLAALADLPYGRRIYNIASGVPVSMAQLAREVASCLGLREGVRFQASLDEGLSMAVDIRRAHRELGFAPAVSLVEGICRTLRGKKGV